jgi:hypothetical protein
MRLGGWESQGLKPDFHSFYGFIVGFSWFLAIFGRFCPLDTTKTLI